MVISLLSYRDYYSVQKYSSSIRNQPKLPHTVEVILLFPIQSLLARSLKEATKKVFFFSGQSTEAFSPAPPLGLVDKKTFFCLKYTNTLISIYGYNVLNKIYIIFLRLQI